MIFQPDVIATHAQHLTHQRTDDKGLTGVHTGNRIIYDHDLILARVRIGLAAAHQAVEVQEINEVTLTLAELFRNLAILSDNLISTFDAFLFAEPESFKLS